MTISISSLNQNTQTEPKNHKSSPPSKAPIKSTKKTHSQHRTHDISRLIASRRRRGVKNTDEEDGEDGLANETNGHPEPESSSSNDDSSISSLVNSDEDEDDDEDDFDNDNDDENNKNQSANPVQINGQNKKHVDPTRSDNDDGIQFQVDPDDLEAGVPKPAVPDSQPNENIQNHSDPQSITKDSLIDDQAATKTAQTDTSSTFFPNKIAKVQLGQTPSDDHSSSSHTGHSNTLSPPTSSANHHNARTSKQQPSSVAVSSQPLNTAIIFNQASWVTGLSAALAATTTPSNSNAPSTDDQPAQTPRYIPYIEFENYSAYGNLIFDLNSGLGRTARVDRKPDGLEKAPPAALEEQFVRIQPSLEHPKGSGQPSAKKGSRRKSNLPVDDQPDVDQNRKDEAEDGQSSRRASKSVSLSERNKKKKKKKNEEALTHVSSEGHDEEAPNESSDQRFKIKIISPPSSSSKNRVATKASSALASHHNLPHYGPSSSLANGLNRPSSAFSYAAHSEGNRSGSASEAHSLEPWAVPRSGRFWGHDDRQSYSQRRGGRGGFVQNRGGNGSARGALRKRAGFRVDWPSTPPSSRRSLASHASAHRPETPAGQSDASRSVGSGAGWITVPPKQKGFGAGFSQNRHSQLHSHKHKSDQADGGEWRHDGWEEIEREAGRKRHPNHRGRGGSGVNLQSRSGTGWRGGAPSIPTRRSATNFAAASSNRSSQVPTTLETPAVGEETENITSKSPNHLPIRSDKAADAVLVPSNPTKSTEDLQIKITQDSLSKHTHDVDSYEEATKVESVTTSDTATRPNQSSIQSDAVPSEDTDATPITLPKTIKIGTIPVYPPVTLQSVAPKKSESQIKMPSSPNDQGDSSISVIDQSPTTPELSDTPQVSRSASTLDDHPSPHPGPGFTPVISTEAASGSITLGSVGGAEVLREAMSTPKSLQPSYPSQHDSMIPQSRFEHPIGMINPFGHSRTSSFNSHTFPLASYGPHPDFAEQPSHLPHPPPPNLPHNHHQPHLASSATYHNPIPAPLPQTIHSPANLYQPQLSALPPLQYFDPNNHHLSYPHPSSLGPPPINVVYGGFVPQPPPPPPQVATSRPHPPIYHPQPTTFEPAPPPLPPPPPSLSAPATSATSGGVILPGHFAPPKSTKVRISNPGSTSGNLSTTDHHHSFHHHLSNHSSRIPSDTVSKSTDSFQIKTTETGINYYEHKGVTYFGDCIPTIPPDDEKLSGAGAANTNRNAMTNDMGINQGFMIRSGDEITPDDSHRFYNFPHYHHQYQSNGPLGHGFDISGHMIESSVPDHPISIDRPPLNSSHQHHHPVCHTNNAHSITGSSGQVVLSQVIRPPPIPFG